MGLASGAQARTLLTHILSITESVNLVIAFRIPREQLSKGDREIQPSKNGIGLKYCIMLFIEHSENFDRKKKKIASKSNF